MKLNKKIIKFIWFKLFIYIFISNVKILINNFFDMSCNLIGFCSV